MKRTYVRPVDSGPRTPTTSPVPSVVVVSSSSLTVNWTSVPTATSYTVRRQINGIYSPVGTVSALTFTDAGLNPSTTYSYTVSAINQFGEGPQSAPASGTTQPSAIPAGNIQMTPGHWVTPDRGSGSGGQSGQLAFIASLASDPYIVGVVLAAKWGEYDSGTTGPNYTPGYALVDAWVGACASAGKKLVIRMDWSVFSTATNITNSLGAAPAWFQQGASTTVPSYIILPPGAAGGLATSSCYWYAPTMNAYIALIQALATRYNSNTTFEGFRFPETSSAAPSSAGHTTANDLVQYGRLFPAARLAAPTKEISIAGNYEGADSDTLSLIQTGIANKVMCTAGPDSGPQRTFQFNTVFCGYINGAKTGTDYRGIFPNISENQYPNEASGGNSATTTPQIIWEWQQLSGPGAGDPSKGGAMNPNKFIWQQSTYTGPAPGGYNYYTWTQVKAFIDSIKGQCNTVIPPSYSGPPPLTATWASPLPDGTVGVPYSYTLSATGGVPPYTYAIPAGQLPPGLSLNTSTGAISGTPTVDANMMAVTPTVSDSAP